MAESDDIKRYRQNLQAEREAIALYTRMAGAEKIPDLASVYLKLAETEKKHAEFWTGKLREAGAAIPEFRPGWRTRIFGWLARIFGTAFIIPTLASIETSAASSYAGQQDAESANMPSDEQSHARVFGYLASTSRGLQGSDLARFEGRHRAAGGNALRAAVLGANDGLVSVFCLVMGVAGAGIPSKTILLTGLAGMLAGAFSMALGEWLSVQSSRELFQHQLDVEKNELATIPEEEKEELALIYQAKGIDAETARAMADRLISDPSTALDTLAREELGIDPNELGGSAWEAAFTSLALFVFGAMIPVTPYIFLSGVSGIVASAACSALGLFVIGAIITLMTGRNPLISGMRQVLFGLVTAAITYSIGHLIGVSLI
ncbi:MAG: VIT1/CCC1 transporter family protein [Spirochaetes bacterium]|nr:VIT1/CCC1 transporter family protein [Spirochaetota bacterium]